MKSLLLAAAIIISQTTLSADLDSFFSKTDSFLKKYVSKGEVAYKKIKINKIDIESLYNEISGTKVGGESENVLKAFYTNAYNILVIHSIVEKYPVKSPMDIQGFFDQKKHNVAGEQLTLNELEKNKLLNPYKDARFHFVLVCAAKSCPPLSSDAFTPAKIDSQLQERTSLTINDEDWLKVNPSTRKIELSKIFEWYQGDFTSEGKSVIDWINKYRNEKISTSNTISYYEYDWSLNE
ncbi:MAG: DUF547 domain-containing protein [Cyclobacteriaceae bacterium]